MQSSKYLVLELMRAESWSDCQADEITDDGGLYFKNNRHLQDTMWEYNPEAFDKVCILPAMEGRNTFDMFDIVGV